MYQRQPDQRTENSRWPSMGLPIQHKNLAPGGHFQLFPEQNMYEFSEMDITLNSKTYKLTKIKKTYRTNKA